jgi:hypothetical protein
VFEFFFPINRPDFLHLINALTFISLHIIDQKVMDQIPFPFQGQERGIFSENSPHLKNGIKIARSFKMFRCFVFDGWNWAIGRDGY